MPKRAFCSLIRLRAFAWNAAGKKLSDALCNLALLFRRQGNPSPVGIGKLWPPALPPLHVPHHIGVGFAGGQNLPITGGLLKPEFGHTGFYRVRYNKHYVIDL